MLQCTTITAESISWRRSVLFSAAMIRLITIRFSHYCEKARWALDHSGIDYEERSHLPLFAWFPALAGGRKRTVPVLVGDGERLSDSTDILRWVDRRSGKLHLD